MKRLCFSILGVLLLSIVFGMIGGNMAMYVVNYGAIPLRHQPIDMIAAAYASMISAGAAGFLFGLKRKGNDT